MNFLKTIWLWLGDTKEQIVSISAVLGVVIAFSGLRTWRKELKGKAEYQKAKDILKAVYRVRNGFMVVRSPWMDASEYPPEVFDETGQLKVGRRLDAMFFAYRARIKILDDAFRELEEQALDAQAEWGTEFQMVLIPLRVCRTELSQAIQLHLQNNEGRMREALSKEMIKSIREKLYYVGEDFEGDPFTPQINKAIAGFEKKLRPHINKTSFASRILAHPLTCVLRSHLSATATRILEEMKQ